MICCVVLFQLNNPCSIHCQRVQRDKDSSLMNFKLFLKILSYHRILFEMTVSISINAIFTNDSFVVFTAQSDLMDSFCEDFKHMTSDDIQSPHLFVTCE